MPIFEVYDAKSPRRVLVESERVTIGRVVDNGVIIDDRQASRIHCEIRRDNGCYILRDLKSRNGTQLNQEDVSGKVDIYDGDEIAIGKASIRFWTRMELMSEDARKLPLIRSPQKSTVSESSSDAPPAARTGTPVSKADTPPAGEVVAPAPTRRPASSPRPRPRPPVPRTPAPPASEVSSSTVPDEPSARPAAPSPPAARPDPRPRHAAQATNGSSRQAGPECQYCCDTMTEMVNFSSPAYLDPYECPQKLLMYSNRHRQYGLLIHDGSHNQVPIYYCPWCGARLMDIDV